MASLFQPWYYINLFSFIVLRQWRPDVKIALAVLGCCGTVVGAGVSLRSELVVRWILRLWLASDKPIRSGPKMSSWVATCFSGQKIAASKGDSHPALRVEDCRCRGGQPPQSPLENTSLSPRLQLQLWRSHPREENIYSHPLTFRGRNPALPLSLLG